MPASAPLPSVESPQHYVLFPHESPDPYILPQEQSDAGTPSSTRTLTPPGIPKFTEEKLFELDKQRAITRRERLRQWAQKAGISHDLGGELDESSSDPWYWFEMGHYFGREILTIEFAMKAQEGGMHEPRPTFEEDSPFSKESQKRWAVKCRDEFHFEARKAGLNLLNPSKIDDSSRDLEYWTDEACFYFNETQKVKELARKAAARAAEQEATRPSRPPRVLSLTEEKQLEEYKQLTMEHREDLRSWVHKAELELLDLGEVDESSRDQEYWRAKYYFYYEEVLRVKLIYEMKFIPPRGHMTVGTDPETGKSFLEELVIYDNDNEKGPPQSPPSTDRTPKPKKAPDRIRAAKPRASRKTKPSNKKASRAEPASRGAISKRPRIASPITSRLRSKDHPLQPTISGAHG